jgi:hypothetical protein
MASADSSRSSEAAPNSAARYLPAILAASTNPEAIENLYRAAIRDGGASAFASAVTSAHETAPDDLLLSAWYYRLRQTGADGSTSQFTRVWLWIVPIGVLLGLAITVFSEPTFVFAVGAPLLAFLAGPLVAFAIVLLLASGGRRSLWLPLAGVVLGALVVYVFLLPGSISNARALLVAVHLPLLAWAAIGLAALGWRSSSHERFAFITKSLEAIGTGGVFGIAGGIFAGVAIGMFNVLDARLPNVVMRLVVGLVAGLVTVFAVATVYDPALTPGQQEFGRGFGRVLIVLMRVLLVLSLLALVVYIMVIPFNFAAPFQNRNTLIIYNVMLFGIVALLIGSTPIGVDGLTLRMQTLLRATMIAVAALTALVSLYALAATIYRASVDGLTMNRATIIGWNIINIALLIALLLFQARTRREDWPFALQQVFAWGAIAYVIWAAVAGLALPWLFRR